MRVEDRRPSRRWLRPALVLLLLAVTVTIPTWLWMTRGRRLPLRAVLDPPSYVVAAGRTLPLRPRIQPERDDAVLTWSGPGVSDGVFTAPARPGLYTVSLQVRRSGTTVEDSVSIRVTRRDPASYPLARPPAAPTPPRGEPSCEGEQPSVAVHGRPCRGATLVVELKGPAGRAWHRWDTEGHTPLPGRLRDLVLPPGASAGSELAVQSVLEPAGESCLWRLRTPVTVADCRAGPRPDAVFAAYSWQMVGPGHFRFAALPLRGEAPQVTRHAWDFGDGTTRASTAPMVAHRFADPPKHYHRVKLTVETGAGSATTERVVVDRSVPE